MAVHFSLSQNMKNLGRYLKRARFVVLPNPYGQTGILRARFNDAVFVSLKHRYLFTSNEKVANSTLRATFQNLECDGKLCRLDVNRLCHRRLKMHLHATCLWIKPGQVPELRN